MHIIFSDAEKEWLDTSKPFLWKIKNGCPEKIKTILQKKLELLYKQQRNMKDE